MMFVVTPSLDTIEHKFNSKSIKFPKLHKVPTLEAININKPWSEWKERLRNFGVKPPKRGIELGWVTRGIRPKKPSTSRGFAREARGAQGTRRTRGIRGTWGLKTGCRTRCPMGARRVPDGVSDEGRMGCLTGPDGVPDGGWTGCPTGAGRGTQQGARRGQTRARRGVQRGQTECPTD
jgi:hypothetical protein